MFMSCVIENILEIYSSVYLCEQFFIFAQVCKCVS